MALRGSKPVSDRDWLFGSRPRRLALRALLREPGRSWTKADLARAAGVSPKGGIDEHVVGFLRIGLLASVEGRLLLADPAPAFRATLARLLDELDALPEGRVVR